MLWHKFQEQIASKWLEIDKDDLQMKLLPLNVDFNSLSLDSLRSTRPKHASVKEEYPPKMAIFRTGDVLFIGINIDDLEWLWTPKVKGF